MNKFYFLIFCFFYSAYLNAQSFQIAGQINNAGNKLIYISYYSSILERGITDSSIISNNNFSFEGQLTMPALAIVRLANVGSMENAALIFIEPGKMTLRLDANSMADADLKGSGAQKEYDTLKFLQDTLAAAYKIYLDSMGSFSETQVSETVLIRQKEYAAKKMALDTSFMLTHPHSIVTAFFLQPYFRKMTKERIVFYYNNMGDLLQKSIYGTQVSDHIEALSRASIGDPFTDFERVDINNKVITLRQFQGKYILLDFWASWCIPCRQENPYLIELYKNFHAKGLEIIAIADDDNHIEMWKEAVRKDGTDIWHHVLRGADKQKAEAGVFNPQDLNNLYGVRSLPTQILIDAEGKIVYNSSRKNNIDLKEKLKSVLEK